MVLFDEFSHYCIQQSLDLDEFDEDDKLEQETLKNLKKDHISSDDAIKK